MGWASGSRVFDEVIKVMQKHIPDYNQRVMIYEELIDVFRDNDWDTEDECMGIDEAFDEALGYNEEEE